MDINNNHALTLIIALKRTIAESDWPQVIPALRQEPQLWEDLQDPDFRAFALAEASDQVEKWAPGELALLALGEPTTTKTLQITPLSPLESSLGQSAEKAFEAFYPFEKNRKTNSTDSDEDHSDYPLTLTNAGLIALYLREEYRIKTTWNWLPSLIEKAPHSEWLRPLACLYSYIPTKLDLLTELVNTNTSNMLQDLGLEVILCNPLSDEELLHLFQTLIKELPPDQRLRVLHNLQKYRKNLIISLVKELTKKGNGIREHYLPETLEKTSNHLFSAEMSLLKNELEKATLSFDAALNELINYQRCLVEKLADSAHRSGDNDIAIKAWQSRAEQSNQSERFLARIALAKLQQGETVDFESILPEASEDVLVVYSKAILLLQDNEPDLPEIRESARKALQSAANSADKLSVDFLKDLTSLLLEINLAYEAQISAKLALDLRHDDPDLLSLLGRARCSGGDFLGAVECLHMAVALAPDQLPLRYHLADCLEAAGDWNAALLERTTILERVASPQLADLRGLAFSAIRAGEWQRGIKVCQQALQLDRNDGLTYALLGEAHYELGEPEVATDYFQKATQLAPHHPTPWLTLARVQSKAGDIQRALETLRAATHAVPDASEIHFALGKHYLAENSLTQAVTAFRRAAEISPEDPDIAYHLGSSLYELGRMAEARQALEPAYHARPNETHLAQVYANTLLALGENRQALKPLVLVLRSGHESAEPYIAYAKALLALEEQPHEACEALSRALEIKPLDLEAKALLAEALSACGDYDRSLETYKETFESTLPQDPIWLSRLSRGLGEVALHLGEVETAVAALQEGLVADPQNQGILKLLAKAYIQANLPEDALQNAREALRQSPDDIDVLTWFAELAVQINAQAEAITSLTRAIELAPGRTDLKAILGWTQMKVDDTAGAWDSFIQILNATDTTSDDLRKAAKGLLDLGDASSAVACLERATEIVESPSKETLVELAFANQIAGEPEAALNAIERAIALNGQDPGIQLTKAKLLIQLSRPQAAIASLEHAITLDPGDQKLYREAIKLLRTTGDVQRSLSFAEDMLKTHLDDLGARNLAAELARSLLQMDYARRILNNAWPLEEPEIDSDSPGGEIVTHQLDFYHLFTELSLEANEEIAAAEALNFAIRLDPENLRGKAIQGRLTGLQGDPDSAHKIYREILDGIQEKPVDESPSLAKYLDPVCELSIADLAVDLNDWETAFLLYDRVIQKIPYEPYPHLRKARSIVLRAEAQRRNQMLDIIRHTPGFESLSDAAQNAFQSAIQSATETINGGRSSTQITRWRARGNTVFHPNGGNIQSLASLPASPDNTASLIAAHRQVGDIESAIKLGRSYPKNPQVMAELAISLLDAKPVNALAAARTAAEGEPRQPIYLALLAKAAYQMEDYLGAFAALETALNIWPDEARWHALAAKILAHTLSANPSPEILEERIEHLQLAVTLEPDFGDHYFQLGRAYLEQCEVDLAIETLERAIELQPDNAEYWLIIAKAQFEAQKYKKATRNAEKSIELDPKSVEAYLVLAKLAIAEKKPGVALTRTQSALQLSPDNSHALHIQAIALNLLNRPTEALNALEKAIPRISNPLPLQLERAKILRHARGLDVALHALNELEDEYPDEPDILCVRAKALAETGDYEQAIQNARRALQLGKETLDTFELARLHQLIGGLSRRAGQLDQAIHHLSAAIQLDPNAIEAYLQMGQTHLERRQFTKALDTFEQAIEVAPDNPKPYYQAGLALKEFKDYVKAEEMLRKAVELSPDDLSIHRQLGAVIALNIVHSNREASRHP